MAWTKLLSVNRVLRAGGEHPVSTLASTSGDSLLAESLLDEVSYEVQMVGLVCNTEELTYSPDTTTNEITIADNVLHLDVLTSDIPENLIVVRGNRLYNATDNTYEFDGDVTARVVSGLAFEDLPFPMQLQITDETARRYQMITVGDPQMDGMLRAVYLTSRAKARAADIRNRQLNLFGNMQSRLPYEAAKQTMRRMWTGWGARRV